MTHQFSCFFSLSGLCLNSLSNTIYQYLLLSSCHLHVAVNDRQNSIDTLWHFVPVFLHTLSFHARINVEHLPGTIFWTLFSLYSVMNPHLNLRTWREREKEGIPSTQSSCISFLLSFPHSTPYFDSKFVRCPESLFVSWQFHSNIHFILLKPRMYLFILLLKITSQANQGWRRISVKMYRFYLFLFKSAFRITSSCIPPTQSFFRNAHYIEVSLLFKLNSSTS